MTKNKLTFSVLVVGLFAKVSDIQYLIKDSLSLL